MNFKKAILSAVSLTMAVLFSGCFCKTAYDCKFGNGTKNVKIDICKTTAKISIDGVLDKKEWAGATVHSMNPAYVFRDKKIIPPKVYANMNLKNRRVDKFQGGTVRLMYDDKYLYIGAFLEDSDVVQYGKANQSPLFLTGDVLEMFLKPVNAPSYWECYGTPDSRKTSYFFCNRNYPWDPAKNVLIKGMLVAAKVHGTLNNHNDQDKGWTVEVAIPLADLAKTGKLFKPGEPWTVLIARYNYNYGSVESNPHFSTFPELPVVNYHHLEYYADVNWK